jgi:hypothetical protein
MEYNFKLTAEEANILLTVIQELPAKIANPLTKKLMEQAQEQTPQEPAEVVNDE